MRIMRMVAGSAALAAIAALGSCALIEGPAAGGGVGAEPPLDQSIAAEVRANLQSFPAWAVRDGRLTSQGVAFMPRTLSSAFIDLGLDPSSFNALPMDEIPWPTTPIGAGWVRPDLGATPSDGPSDLSVSLVGWETRVDCACGGRDGAVLRVATARICNAGPAGFRPGPADRLQLRDYSGSVVSLRSLPTVLPGACRDVAIEYELGYGPPFFMDEHPDRICQPFELEIALAGADVDPDLDDNRLSGIEDSEGCRQWIDDNS